MWRTPLLKTEHGLVGNVYIHLKFMILTRETEYVHNYKLHLDIHLQHSQLMSTMVRNACQDSTYTDPDFFLVHQYVIPSSTYSARKCGKEDSETWTGIVQVNFNSEAEYSRKASYGAIGSFNSLEKNIKRILIRIF